MITRTIEIKPTPGELARDFARMDSDEQAECLSVMAYEFATFGASMQCAYIRDSIKKYPQAVEFVRLLAEYVTAND